jgi:hypothetical protein
LAQRPRKPESDETSEKESADYVTSVPVLGSGEIRERAEPYGHHGIERDVILAGLGAKVRAKEKGEDFFRALVEKGKTLQAAGTSDPLADQGKAILAYADVLDELIRERRTFSRMVEAMLPEAPLPSAPAVLQARRNAEARASLIQEFGVLTSSQVAELAGSRATNRAALANRWKQEGLIFAVPYQGSEVFPAYQFDEDGRPRPVIAQVLATLGRQSKGWELALWFTGANGWLDQEKRPVDVLQSTPQDVAQAAEREAEGLFF